MLTQGMQHLQWPYKCAKRSPGAKGPGGHKRQISKRCEGRRKHRWPLPTKRAQGQHMPRAQRNQHSPVRRGHNTCLPIQHSKTLAISLTDKSPWAPLVKLLFWRFEAWKSWNALSKIAILKPSNQRNTKTTNRTQKTKNEKQQTKNKGFET